VYIQGGAVWNQGCTYREELWEPRVYIQEGPVWNQGCIYREEQCGTKGVYKGRTCVEPRVYIQEESM
jgi:hypothetical protein